VEKPPQIVDASISVEPLRLYNTHFLAHLTGLSYCGIRKVATGFRPTPTITRLTRRGPKIVRVLGSDTLAWLDYLVGTSEQAWQAQQGLPTPAPPAPLGDAAVRGQPLCTAPFPRSLRLCGLGYARSALCALGVSRRLFIKLRFTNLPPLRNPIQAALKARRRTQRNGASKSRWHGLQRKLTGSESRGLVPLNNRISNPARRATTKEKNHGNK
jgi:hypothetical protein